MKEIKDLRSLNDHGPYSAYCRVCWCPIYALWIDKEPHGGKCMHGHLKATDCAEAMGDVRFRASVISAVEGKG